MAASTILYHIMEEKGKAAKREATDSSGTAAERTEEIERLEGELSDARAQLQGLVEACRDARQAMIEFSNLLNWPDWTPTSYYTALNHLRAWIDYAEGKEADLCVNEYLEPFGDRG